jgi:hypothetical protein
LRRYAQEKQSDRIARAVLQSGGAWRVHFQNCR